MMRFPPAFPVSRRSKFFKDGGRIVVQQYQRTATLRCTVAFSTSTISSNAFVRTAGRRCFLSNTTTAMEKVLAHKDNEGDEQGEAAFRLYEEAEEELEEFLWRKEEERSKELYKAWKRAEVRASASAKSGGLAVVKTIVEQHKGSDSKKKDDEEDKEKMLERRVQELLERAALELRHPRALVILGSQSQKGGAIDRALELYREAGERGAAEGWFNLGSLLWSDQTSDVDITSPSSKECVLAPDRSRAMIAFEKAVEMGDSDSMYFVGVAKLATEEDGEDVEELRSGLELVERAAQKGHGGALYYLALFHLNGHTGLQVPPCSNEMFVDMLDAAANADHPDALFLRGHCLYHGDNGYEQNTARALGDFLKAAADKGNADAAVSAGAILFTGGGGVPRDQRTAFQLYQRGGELGNIEGWRNVAACYATGEGVAQSKNMAKYIADTMLKEGTE